MPGTVRPNKKISKIAYALLNTPKDLRQKDEKNPGDKRVKQWFRDCTTAQ